MRFSDATELISLAAAPDEPGHNLAGPHRNDFSARLATTRAHGHLEASEGAETPVTLAVRAASQEHPVRPTLSAAPGGSVDSTAGEEGRTHQGNA